MNEEIRCWFCRRTIKEVKDSKEFKTGFEKTTFGGHRGKMTLHPLVFSDKHKIVPVCPICEYMIGKFVCDINKDLLQEIAAGLLGVLDDNASAD